MDLDAQFSHMKHFDRTEKILETGTIVVTEVGIVQVSKERWKSTLLSQAREYPAAGPMFPNPFGRRFAERLARAGEARP